MKHTLYLLCAAVLCSCAGNERPAGESDPDYTMHDGVIVVRDDSPVLSHLKVDTVRETMYSRRFTTSGVVRAISNSYAEIASPVAGRITRSFVRLGQRVAKGSPVFEISSPAFFETTKAYFQARQEMELARKSLDREKDLLAHGVGVQKQVEESEVDYEIKKKDYENAVAALSVFQIDPAQLALGQPLVVRSPIAGEIVRNDIVLGQYIREDADPLAIVADLSRVWVAAQVKEKDIPLLDNLSAVGIRLTAMPDTLICGRIYHISELLDEQTRSAEVLIECDNRDRRLKPFMYGTVELTDRPAAAIVVPTSAILQHEDHCYVLSAEAPGRFRRVEVETLASERSGTVVSRGLEPLMRIVSEGAFYLIEAK